MTQLWGRLTAARQRARAVRGRVWLLASAVVVLVVAGACDSTNTYPIDFFQEMHYQKSWHAQEPNRPDIPPNAIPINAASPVPNYTREQAGQLRNPFASDQAAIQRGADLFKINCQQCHGADGKGDGYLVNYSDAYKAQGVNPPADLTSDLVQNRSDGELFWIISNGLNRMPAWDHLLTVQERWELVDHIRALKPS